MHATYPAYLVLNLITLTVLPEDCFCILYSLKIT